MNEQDVFTWVIFKSFRTNKEGLLRGRRPTSTRFTITIRPSRILPTIDLVLKHFNNGGMNGKRGSNSGCRLRRHRRTNNKRHNLRYLREIRRTSVKSIRNFFKLKFSGQRQGIILRDQNLIPITTCNSFFMGRTITRLPLGFKEEISHFVNKT